jgi:hypothetical protein
MIYPIYHKVSTPTLLDMHSAIQKAMDEDDKNPSPEKIYGVRVYPDWRAHSDKIENVLDSRSAAYIKIKW